MLLNKKLLCSCIVGYTRDEKGRVKSHHTKMIANTIHTSTGSGGSTDQFALVPTILRQERTDEERARRHLYGDKDAKFSQSKVLRPRKDGMSNTISTVQKDNLLLVHMRDGSTRHARIRKLTPRECFRLMDVDDKNIDKMMNSGVSKTQLFKAAGNSICVGVLTALFDKLFINTGAEAEVGKEQSLW